jgi:hypothetical protein
MTFILKKKGTPGMPVIPALKRLSQEDHEFVASLSYIVNLKKKKKKLFFTLFCFVSKRWGLAQEVFLPQPPE